MGKATAPNLRQEVYQGWESDLSYAEISRQTSVNYHVVRKLCKNFDEDGKDGLIPRYSNCGQGRKPGRDNLIYRASCWLKRKHPTWGADFIRLILEEHYPEYKIPTARAMQKWYKALGLNRARTKVPKEDQVWAKEVHEVWQVDAKEQLSTGDGQPATWLTVTDEYSGAILDAPVFPPKPDRTGSSIRDPKGSD